MVDYFSVFLSLMAGLFATLMMSIFEFPFWRKWGIEGVLEWHENQVISTRFFHISNDKPCFKYIFFLHFLNGSLAGIGFLLILSILNIPITGQYVVVLSLTYGLVLWIVTLLPIHKPITGHSVWNHQLGHLPSIASLTGHLIYGLVLGLVIMTNY